MENKKDLIGYLSDRLENKNLTVVFGLKAQGHLPTIQKILDKWNTVDPELGAIDMTYSSHVWKEIGEEIGWDPLTAALSYFEIMNKK